MSKKSHHFLTLWPWPLTYDLEKLIRSGHYHYQCVYQIWEQSIPWFLSCRVNTIAGGAWRATGGGRLWRKTITSPDPSDTGDIIMVCCQAKGGGYSNNAFFPLYNGVGVTHIMAWQVWMLPAFSASSASLIHWSLLTSTMLPRNDDKAAMGNSNIMIMTCRKRDKILP